MVSPEKPFTSLLDMLKKVLSTASTSQKPDVNGEIIELFSTYESRNTCRNNPGLSQKLIATYIDILKFDTVVIQEVKTYIRKPFTQYETSDPGYIYQNEKMIKTGITKQEESP